MALPTPGFWIPTGKWHPLVDGDPTNNSTRNYRRCSLTGNTPHLPALSRSLEVNNPQAAQTIGKVCRKVLRSELHSLNVVENHAIASPAPRISIGMPVYNGSRFIAEAITSILTQTFEDFELIICDNASTDETREICLQFAAQDVRIRYHRNPKNIGAGPNFNLAVSFARGEYFKWAAHDDLCHPEFLERCINLLDSDPDAVLAFPQARIIDAESNPVELNKENQRTAHKDPVIRFKDLTRGHRCFQVFGLIRMSDLKATPMIGLFARGDALLLCWLALRGRFVKIDEVMFFPRRHDAQSMSMLGDKRQNRKTDYVAYSAWFDPRLRKRMVFPWWRGSWELMRCVAHAPISTRNRLSCFMHVFKWIYSRRRALAHDVLFQWQQVTQTGFGGTQPLSTKQPAND